MDGVRPGSERGTIRTQVDAIGTGVQSNGPQHGDECCSIHVHTSSPYAGCHMTPLTSAAMSSGTAMSV